MKLNFQHIFATLLMVPLLVAQGCIFDDFPEEVDGDSTDGFNTVGYMAVRLMPSDGGDSRAVGDDFNMGSNAEFLLCNEAGHYAIFYGDGPDSPPIAISNLNGMSSDINPDIQANSSVVYATIAAREELKETLMKLKECYVILNTDIPRETFLTYTRDDLLNIRVNSPFFTAKNGTRYFTMCNSVYVDNGKKKIFTEVDTDKIYTSYLETIEQAWKGNAAVNAYVERLSAKFSVRFENNDFNNPNAERVFIPQNNNMVLFSYVTSGDIPVYEDRDLATGTPYSYRIRITGWGLNALEQESFLFRNFNPNINYFTNWTNTAYKRVYWSEDPNYGKASYPWQYRKVIDNSGLHVYENNNNILQNFAFGDLNNNIFGGGFYQYAPENTYDFADKAFAAALDNKPELLAGTHIIVCGEMLSNVENPNVWAPHEIYRDRNGSFYRNELECVKALVASMNNTLKSHSFLKFKYWDWDKGGVEYLLFGSTVGEFALYYKNRKLDTQYVEELYNSGIRLTADAEFKGSDGKRILWADGITIQNDRGQKMQSYSNIDEVNPENNEYLRESSVNDTKSVIFEHVGAVDHYSDGKLYYAIPVGYIKADDSATGVNVPYSIYGVVRNSTYDILIRNVTGVGAAVDRVEQPIVPNAASTSDHLFIGFEILDWHPIDQNVPGQIK